MSIQELLTSGLGEGHPEIWHANRVPAEERLRLHGHAVMDSEGDLRAGQHTTVSFTVHIGEEEVEAGGRVGITWRWPFDWSDLQPADPKGQGYVVAAVETGDSPGSAVELNIDYQRQGGIEPWHHLLVIEVRAGRLRKGDRVRITCGDRSQGGPGWRAPTCRLKECGFLVLVDRSGSGRWVQLLDLPTFRVVAREPVRLVAVAASQAIVGVPLSLMVRGEDEWGNTTNSPEALGQLRIEIASGPGDVEAHRVRPREDADDGYVVHDFWVTFRQPGLHTLGITSETLGGVETNPINVRGEQPELNIYWGDLHAGQTEMGCGTGTVEEHFRYGRDVAAVSFLSEQSNDHYVTTNDWKVIREASEALNEPGRFVTYLGCEWSPYTPAGGDRNVFYLHDEPRLQRSGRYFVELEPDPEPDLPTAPEFHDAFKNKDVLVNIHVGGRRTNLDYFEPSIERLAEIHSTHGTIEWFIEDALERGYRVAITAGTDGVMTRPAADHPGWRLIRNLPSGLTAVYAGDLTREGLWEALKARRCYATTGARMLIAVDVDGQMMGAEYESDGNPTVNVEVTGTSALERVDLLRGTTRVQSWDIATAMPAGPEGERFLRILWGGTAKKGTARFQRLQWDGRVTLAGGRILDVQPINFISPIDTVALEGDGSVSWKCSTAGSDAGIVLKLEAPDDALLDFESPSAAFSRELGEVIASVSVVDAGGFNRHVTIGPAPDPAGARSARLSFQDEDPADGWNPYWIRVVQIDAAKGWSSPVYMKRATPARSTQFPATSSAISAKSPFPSRREE